jgi:3-oxoacyl-[acyl-carrier-protein] synthase-3
MGEVGGKPSRARPVVLKSNRIKSRYYAIDRKTLQPTHSNAQLTAEAVSKLVDENFSLADIQCLACGTSMADQLMPNHAVMVHGELGIPPCEVVATAGVCVSGMSAMKYAYMAIASGTCRNAVATGSELASAVMHARNFEAEIESRVDALEHNPEIAFEKDFLRWMLSDGAGAALLQPAPDTRGISLKIEWIELRSYANEIETCMYAGAVKVDGKLKGWNLHTHEERARDSIMAVKQDVKLLNSNVIHYTVERPLAELIDSKHLVQGEIDWFLPHYSSEYFREKVYEGLKRIGFEIPYEKWFTNLTDKGNTGAASIYIMLAELMESGKIKRGEKILCYIPESGRFSSCFMRLTAV